MKLKLSLALGLLMLSLGPVMNAVAEIKNFEMFIVDIPPGWSTEFKSGDNDGFGANLFVSKEDQSAMVSYTLEKLKSGQWNAMIKEMTENPKPDTGPAQVNSANSFLVTFTDNRNAQTGKETYYRIGEDRYVKEVTIGYADDMNIIIKSFQVNKISQEEEM